MAQKVRRPAIDYAVYLAVRSFVCVIQALPMSLAFAVATLLAKLAYQVDRRHRVVAAENIQHAFPEKTEREVDTIVRRCYEHFCLLVVEIAILPRKLHLDGWRTYCTIRNTKPIMDALLSRRPALLVTAHFGNWEMAGFSMGALGVRSYAIARVLDNPYLERYLKQFRQRTGQTIIAKKDDFARLTTVLTDGGKVATLGDQDAGPRGVFVDFFGRPASAHKAVALMAIEFQAKLVVIGVPRVGPNMQYDFLCNDVIDPADYADHPDAVKLITERYHAALEKMIRKYPEQYFWLHRRWKTRPIQKRTAAQPSRAAA